MEKGSTKTSFICVNWSCAVSWAWCHLIHRKEQWRVVITQKYLLGLRGDKHIKDGSWFWDWEPSSVNQRKSGQVVLNRTCTRRLYFHPAWTNVRTSWLRACQSCRSSSVLRYQKYCDPESITSMEADVKNKIQCVQLVTVDVETSNKRLLTLGFNSFFLIRGRSPIDDEEESICSV